MKNLTVFLFIVLAPSICSAQHNVDSLKAVWENQSLADTARLNALHVLGKDVYLGKRPDSAYHFSTLQYTFADSVGNDYWKADALHIQGTAFYVTNRFDKAKPLLKQAITIWDNIDKQKESANSLHNLGNCYLNSNVLDSAVQCFRNTITVRSGISDSSGLAGSHISLGGTFHRKGDYDSSLVHSNQGLVIAESVDNSGFVIRALTNLGNTYHNIGRYEKAINAFYECMNVAKADGDKKYEAISLGNLAKLYKEQNEYRKSVSLSGQAYDVLNEINDHFGAGISLIDKGAAYHKLRMTDSAMYCYWIAFDHATKSNRPPLIAACYQNIGNLYRDLENLDSAKSYLNKAIDYKRSVGMPVSTANLNSLGAVFRKLGNPRKGIELGKEALAIADERGSLKGLQESNKQLYWSYKEDGKFEKALEHLEQHIAYKDSILKLENQRELIRTEFREKEEEQEREVELAKAEATTKTAEAKVERSKRLTTTGVGGAVILLLTGGGFFYNRDRKRKHELAINKVELSKKLVENDFLRSRLDPHFVSNALMSANELVQKNDTEAAVNYLNRFNELMRSTLENSALNLISLSEELEMLELYMEMERPRLTNGLDWNIEVGVGIHAEEVMLPPLILQPLVENAIKHGVSTKNEKGLITIRVSKDGETVMCAVENTGVPLDEKKLESSTSHGIRLTRERLELFSSLMQANARFVINATNNGAEAKILFNNVA